MGSLVPKLMLSTSAPSPAAYSNAAVTAESGSSPAEFPTLSAMIRHCHPAPAIPAPLSVAAAAIPATNVPWKPSSIPDGSIIASALGSASPLPKSQPFASSPLPSPAMRR